MTSVLAHESELQFELGGPAYRLMQRIGLIKGEDPSIGRRVVGFLLITWVPLLVFSMIENRAIGPSPQQAFLFDFAGHARFLLAVPLLFVAEVVVGPRLRAAGLNIFRAGFVRPEDLPAAEQAIVRSRMRREARLPELIMLAVAVFGAWNLTFESLSSTIAAETWHSVTRENGSHLSLGGIWYHAIAVPILQFFVLRWLWRLIIWTLFLRDMARLNLNTVVTHPDRAGGLGFLGVAHVSIALFPFAVSCILSGAVAFQMRFEGASIESFYLLFAVYLVVVLLVCLGPLLIFVPLLARTRREGLLMYSLLSDRYNRAFERKWVDGQRSPDEALLGSSDIQSLSDLGNSFRMAQEMSPFVFSRQQVLQIAIAAMLPCLPLVLLVMPVGQLLKVLIKALL
jgi:hypothetical protein